MISPPPPFIRRLVDGFKVLLRNHAGLPSLALMGVWFWSIAPLPAQTPATATNDPAAILREISELDAALARELQMPKIRRWDATLNLTTGAGFKDNIMLSHDQAESAAFSRWGAELSLLRLPQNGWQYSAYAAWEDLRYVNATVDKEQMGLAVMQLKKALPYRLEAGVNAQYLYLDQVLDLSDEQSLPQPLPVQLHALTQKISLRQEFRRGWVWETEISHARFDYRPPVDDFHEAGPKLSLGRKYGHRSEWSLGYAYNQRWYDARRPTDATGLALAGARLEYEQHRLQFLWRHHLDERRRWRVGLRLGLERSRDNGADYYGYWKYQFQPSLRYQHPHWSLQASLRWSQYDYPVQTVSPASQARYERTDAAATLKAEVKLAKEIKLQAEWQHERNLSNLGFTEYRANTVWAGFYWEF